MGNTGTQDQSVAPGSVTNGLVSQGTGAGQDPTARGGTMGSGSLTTGVPPRATIAAASNGGNIANIAVWAFPAPGQLAISAPIIPNPSGPYTGGLGSCYVQTSTGMAIVQFTGSQGSILTGCTLYTGTGLVSTGGSVLMVPTPTIDVILGDSIARGDGGVLGATDWMTDLCAIEQNLAGLVPPGPGLVLPFYSDGLYGTLQWATTASGTAVSTASPCPGSGAASPGTVSKNTSILLPDAGASAGDTRPFRRMFLYYLAQPNGSKIAVATTGVVKSLAAIDTHVQTAAVTLGTTNQVTVGAGGFPGAAIGDVVTVYSGTGTVPAGTTVLAINGNTMTLSNVTTAGTATLAYQGLRYWDSSDLNYFQGGTGFTVTSSAHGAGTGAAGLVVVGALYYQGPTVGLAASATAPGSVVMNIAASATQSGDWNGTYKAGWQNFLAFLANSGTPPRRVMVMLGTNDQPGFFFSGNTPATMAANLTAIVQAIQAVTPLSEVVLAAEYYAANPGLGFTGVGNAIWGAQWVTAIQQVAQTTGCTFINMWARFGDCSAPAGDPYGITMDPGIHFGTNLNSVSRRNGQQLHAELFFEDLAYSRQFALTGKSNTSATASASVPTPTSGVAFVPSVSSDTINTMTIAAAANVKVTWGPSTGAENTVCPLVAAPIGAFFEAKVPAGNKLVYTWSAGAPTFLQQNT